MQKEKILILRTEQLGDFIVTIPVFHEIRKKYPHAELTIILKKLNYEFAKSLNIFDKIEVYEDILTQRNLSLLKILKNPLKIMNFVHHLLKLLNEKYDLLIEFSGRKYNKFRSRFIMAKSKILANPEDIRKIDERDRMFKIVSPLRIKKPKRNSFLKKNRKAEEKIRSIIKKNDLKGKRIIATHILSPLNEKNWPLEKFLELFKKLEKENFRFLILGTKDELKKIEPLFKNCKNVVNLLGKLSLFETHELIKKSNLFLGLDSGPLHLAKFTKTPIIAIFGNELEYVRWGPKRKIDSCFENNDLNKIKSSKIAKEIIKKTKNGIF